MDVDTPIKTTGRHVVLEDDASDHRIKMADKATYRSWKKKYRKMRVVFEKKMAEGEKLYRLEQKALATVSRLAVEKDQLLDMLLDINNCSQIPPEKRFDLSIQNPSNERDSLALDIDTQTKPFGGVPPPKSYERLLKEVPHSTYATADERFRNMMADIEAGRDSPADPQQGAAHPPSFLAGDDIDNYIWEADARVNEARARAGNRPRSPMPTMAPKAARSGDGAPAFDANGGGVTLRNPTSVYNWLRKHEPKTFLQDGEKEAAAAHADKDHGDEKTRARGGAKAVGDRSTPGTMRSKRVSAANGREKSVAAAESMDVFDDEIGLSGRKSGGAGGGGGSSGGGGGGKRKRVVDDDGGYRPKGGSSRPTKTKRKSGGGAVAPVELREDDEPPVTPFARRHVY